LVERGKLRNLGEDDLDLAAWAASTLHMETAMKNPGGKVNGEALLDLRRMMGEWRIPNLDLEALAETQRKNVEALMHANQLVMDGAQTALRRNLELARSTMDAFAALLSDLGRPNGSLEERVARQLEQSKTALEKGLTNIRELAELMAKTNSDTVEVLTKRVSESLDEVRSYAHPAA
jgi:phasin family protein